MYSMTPERPPIYSYRNGHGEWMPAPFDKTAARDGGALKIDIKFPVLGFLMEAELTGYDLKRRFQESVGFFYRVSDGSLYPALKKLARDRLVTMHTERNGKRTRKVYAITPLGRHAARTLGPKLRLPLSPLAPRQPSARLTFIFPPMSAAPPIMPDLFAILRAS